MDAFSFSLTKSGVIRVQEELLFVVWLVEETSKPLLLLVDELVEEGLLTQPNSNNDEMAMGNDLYFFIGKPPSEKIITHLSNKNMFIYNSL
jgi:hypothetical protein